MAFSGVRSFWSSVTGSGGTRRIAVEAQGGYDFLPQDSVIISDRNRHANKLGEGSFAKVYRGEYNGKPCAVKVFMKNVLKKELSPDCGGTSDLEMLSKVQHTNIVQMYGIWFDPHNDRAAPSIVMELCDESLYDFIRRFKGKIIPKEKKLPILQDIAKGMVYLHSQNIVHGDLRSSNVLLCHSEDQTVAKIADFDMARFLDIDGQHYFTVRFTAEEYLPPEVFDHKEHKDQKKKWARLTPKVDVFCFGEVVLEMGCGTYPTPTGKFRGQQILTEQQRREKHLAKLKQSDRESLGSIIRKCLADAPEGRPSFTEILLEVDAYLHKYGERPDLEVLQDKTAECEALRAEAVKWEDEAKSLCSVQDELEKELEKERTEKQDLQAEIRQLEQDVKCHNEEVVQHKRRLDLATVLKDTANRDRDSAIFDKEQAKKELAKQRGMFAKERQQFEEQIAAEERAKRIHQERLGEAQKKEHDLNDQLRQYHDKLEASEGAKDKLERAKETLEAEKVAFEKQVRELTYKLEVRAEDLSKKEKQTFNLMKELEEAQKAVAEGNELEPVLRQSIEELEEEKKELLKDLEDKVGKSRKLQRELAEAMEALKTLEVERDQKMETIRVREDKLKDVQRREQDLNDQLQLYHNQLEATKARKAAVEKDLVRARKMAKDLLDERVVVNAESEQQMENLNERLMEFKQQAVLSEERLKQVQGLEGEHLDLKIQLKTLTTTLEDFQKVLTDEQKSRKSLDASVKALMAEITQLRTELKERDNDVSSLTAANGDLQRKVDAADTKITEMKEKLREAEEQVALFQGKRQQLEVFERVAVELKSRLSDLMMDAPPSMTPSVSGGKDGSSAVALTQEAAQKVQQLERERDSLKAERHMYQMKWLAAEDMMKAVKSEKQSLESLREEYKKNFSEAYEVMKSLQQEQEEGGAQHPPDRIKLDALMDICRYYKDERDKEIERAAAEKHCILASKKEADERAEAMACKIAALRMEAAPVPLPSDVVDVTADEALLQQLCYMATGIKKLLVSADGGRFTLGSGDASLEFPPGTVEKETSVRYAIILHGPFVFPAGYKPGSVIIYLNMEGATLLKPVILYLSHWCIKEKGEDEDTLKFASASHTLGAAKAGQQVYVFEEEDDADFTRTNVAVLSIRDPHCLFCVKNKSEKVAMYSAIAFSRYIPSEETLLFRIQLMCDSLEWNEKLTSTLQLKNWEKTSDGDIVTRFQCADGQHRITASPKGMAGPGWRAAVYGQQAVIDEMFLEPLRKTKEEVEQEVSNGRFPPCILYKIIYTGLEVNRVKSALVNIVLHGANVPLSFSCRVKEEMLATPPVSPAYSEPVFGAATSPIPMETSLVSTRDILTALDHRLDAKWRHFGAFLCVEYQVLEAIQRDKGGKPEDCMLDLLSKWTSNQAGLGTLPRTWQTVVETVHHCGDGALAQSLARKHGGQLPH